MCLLGLHTVEEVNRVNRTTAFPLLFLSITPTESTQTCSQAFQSLLEIVQDIFSIYLAAKMQAVCSDGSVACKSAIRLHFASSTHHLCLEHPPCVARCVSCFWSLSQSCGASASTQSHDAGPRALKAGGTLSSRFAHEKRQLRFVAPEETASMSRA